MVTNADDNNESSASINRRLHLLHSRAASEAQALHLLNAERITTVEQIAMAEITTLRRGLFHRQQFRRESDLAARASNEQSRIIDLHVRREPTEMRMPSVHSDLSAIALQASRSAFLGNPLRNQPTLLPIDRRRLQPAPILAIAPSATYPTPQEALARNTPLHDHANAHSFSPSSFIPSTGFELPTSINTINERLYLPFNRRYIQTTPTFAIAPSTNRPDTLHPLLQDCIRAHSLFPSSSFTTSNTGLETPARLHDITNERLQHTGLASCGFSVAPWSPSPLNQDHARVNAKQGQELFPVVLHRILMELELVDGGAKIASFLSDGKSFKIWHHFLFEKHVLPIFFPKMKNFASFQRQLNLYDFKRLDSSYIDRGGYHHALFQRNFPDLATTMIRRKIKGDGATLTREFLQNSSDPSSRA